MGQEGFALVAVLAAVAFASLVIAALVGLMVTTMRVTAQQERTARERRAADGAVEVAIEKLRTELADTADLCVAANPIVLDGELFDQGNNGPSGTAATGDDVSIDVTCEPQGATSGTNQVQVLGNRPFVNAAGALSGRAIDGAVANGMPPAYLNPNSALVSSGPEALRFTSGVTVRTGAAAFRSVGTPALNVAGPYSQGLTGYGATTGNNCGVLGLPGASLISGSSNAPECDSASARALVVHPSEVPLPAEIRTAASLPACGGSVVSFEPGRYDSVATAGVAALTGGGCAGRTFHFKPGIFYFDGELRFSDPGAAYVFGEADGWDLGGGVQASIHAGNPEATLCRTDLSGSTVVLTARSSINHTAGRVAICPALPVSGPADAPPHPAISQERTVPFSVEIADANGPVNTTFSRTMNCTPLPCQSTANGPEFPIKASGSTPITSIAVMYRGDENSNIQNNPVLHRAHRLTLSRGGVAVCDTGFQTGLPNSRFQMRANLLAGGCAAVLTGSEVASLNGMTLRVDTRVYRESTSTSAPVLTFSDLEFGVNELVATAAGGEFSSSTWTSPSAMTAADQTAADPVMPCNDSICAVNDPTRTKNQLYVHEFNVGRFAFPEIEALVAAGEEPSITSLRADMKIMLKSNVFRAPGFLSLSAFRGSQPEYFRPRMRTTVTLRTDAGQRCTVVSGFDNVNSNTGGVNSDQVLSFDMTDPVPFDPANDCNAVKAAITSLDPVGATVRFEMPCAFDENKTACARLDELPFWTGLRPDTKIMQFRPPSIDRFSLSVGTDVYTGPSSRSNVRIAAGDAAGASTFNVYGKAWLPRTTLDVLWAGTATRAPLFSDDLVVNGFGSSMSAGAAMGTVCCAALDSQTVALTAALHGEPMSQRLVARVELSEPERVGPSTRYKQVEVLRWLNCASSGCASALADSDAPVNASPGGG